MFSIRRTLLTTLTKYMFPHFSDFRIGESSPLQYSVIADTCTSFKILLLEIYVEKDFYKYW